MKVAIVGLGVMGGSLVMALSKRHDVFLHAVSRSPASQEWSANLGALVYKNIADLPSDLDFIFLATPSHSLSKMARGILHMGKQTVISDMASAKGEVVPELGNILQNHQYLSCHPMCGSEKTGLDGAKADLYTDKTVILTPHNDRAKSLESQLATFWQDLQCRTVSLEPTAHDQAVAWVSHMPHMVIPMLVQAIAKGEITNPGIFDVAGTGLRDISRLAASNPELWRDIVMDNREALKIALSGVQAELEIIQNILSSSSDICANDLENYLAQARRIHKEKGLAKI